MIKELGYEFAVTNGAGTLLDYGKWTDGDQDEDFEHSAGSILLIRTIPDGEECVTGE